MQGWKPLSVWAVAASVSVAVNLAALVAGGAAWAERPEPRKAAPPLLSHRDVTFLLGYIKKEIKEGKIIPEPRHAEPEPVTAAKTEARPAPMPAQPVADTSPAVVKVPVETPRKVEPPRLPPVPVPEPPTKDVPITMIDAHVAEEIATAKDIPEPSLRAEMNDKLWKQRAYQEIFRNFYRLYNRDETVKRLHGSVVIYVYVNRDGSLAGMQYETHSGHPVHDVMLEQAILRSAPFKPFYALMKTEYELLKPGIRF
jgi:hypothetical protein